MTMLHVLSFILYSHAFEMPHSLDHMNSAHEIYTDYML